MHQGQLVFSQLMRHLPLTTFRRCVARYAGEHKVKSFSCLDQYFCMAFAQLTYRESLRDIESSLRAQSAKLYHLGIRGNVSRNTLANANATRDWRIYTSFAERLIGIARARGTVRRGSGRDGLRARRHDDRFVFVGLPMGTVPVGEGCRQAAHAARSAWQYSELYSHLRRQDARCQRARLALARAGSLLRDGSRLPRLRAAVSPARGWQLLRHARQVRSEERRAG